MILCLAGIFDDSKFSTLDVKHITDNILKERYGFPDNGSSNIGFSNTSNATTYETKKQEISDGLMIYVDYVWVGIVLSAVSGVCLSFLTVTRISTSLSTIDSSTIAFWEFFLGTIPSIICMAVFNGMTWLPTGFETPWMPTLNHDYHKDWRLLFIGVHILCALVISVSTSFAVTGLSAMTISFLSCLSLPCLMLFQYTFLREVNPGHDNVSEYLGFGLVLFATICSPLVALCCTKKPADEDQDALILEEKKNGDDTY